MKIAAYVPDLMDRSRFSGLPADAEVVFVKTPAELATVEGAELIVVDLSRDGTLEVVAEIPKIKKIAFVSHIDKERIDQAKAAGIDEVLARSRFFSRIVELLS